MNSFYHRLSTSLPDKLVMVNLKISDYIELGKNIELIQFILQTRFQYMPHTPRNPTILLVPARRILSL